MRGAGDLGLLQLLSRQESGRVRRRIVARLSPATRRLHERFACCAIAERRNESTSTRGSATTTVWKRCKGAILRVKLRQLDQWTNARRAHAARYAEELAQIGIKPPTRNALRPARLSRLRDRIWSTRERLQQHLTAQQIQTGIHYPYPVHLTGAHADLGYKREDFRYG